MAGFAHPAPQSPVLGFGLFSGPPPGVHVLADAINDEFEIGVSVRWSEGSDGRPAHDTVVVETDDAVILVAPVAAPVPNGEAVRACHPLWWDDITPVEQHSSHVIVTALPRDGRAVDRAQVILQASLFAVVASILMELPDAVALYYGSGGITYPAGRYSGLVVDALEGGESPVDVWTSVWLVRNPDRTVTGYTVGLDTFGHADLTVQGSTLQPAEVFERLTSLAAYVITTGAVLEPGSTIGYGADEQLPLEVSGSDLHPNGALRVLC